MMDPLPPQMPAFLRMMDKVGQAYRGVARHQRTRRVDLFAILNAPPRERDRRVVKWMNSLAKRSERGNRLYREGAWSGRKDRGLR